MDKMTKKIIGAFAAIILVAAAILAIYFLVNRQAEMDAQGDELPKTEVGKLLAKDLELKYPGTPTEVVKLYWRMNRCMYNEDVEDEDLEALLKQLRLLYDEELLAEEKNSYENMLKAFQKDKENYEEKKQTISACVVQENNTVEVKKLDGKECATIISSTLLNAKGDSVKSFEQFICRKDSKGKWRILGWKQTSAKEAAKVGVK